MSKTGKQAMQLFGDGSANKVRTTPPELYDFYANNGSDTGAYNDEPSLTRQEFSDECDINVIMAQYEKTGVISHVSQREPMYLDLTSMPDLRGAMEIMEAAETAFMSLPAKVRREFDNDPQMFVDFASDPANLDKMREFGLAPPAVVVEEPPKAAPPATEAGGEVKKAEGGSP